MRTSRSLARPLGAVAVAALALLLGACSTVEAGHGAYADPKAASTAAPVTDSAPATAPSDSGPADGGPADTTPGGDDTTSPAPSDSDSPGPGDAPDSPSSADTASVAKTAEDFYHAFGAEDGEKVCALMTDAVAAGLGSTGTDCPSVAKAKAAELGADVRAALTRLSVDESAISVSGDTANVPAAAMTVDGSHSDEAGAIQLTRESGGWKISGAQ
jgi:hypothetical protein